MITSEDWYFEHNGEGHSFKPTDGDRKAPIKNLKAARKPKEKRNPGTISNLLSLSGQVLDRNFFYASIAFEVFGMILLFRELGVFYNPFAVSSIIIAATAIILVILDYFLANNAHKNRGDYLNWMCEVEIMKRLSFYQGAPDIELENARKKHFSAKRFSDGAIIAIAIIKTAALVGLSGRLGAEFWIASVLYAFVAYIHIFHTSHYFVAKRYYGPVKEQYSKWRRDIKTGLNKEAYQSNSWEERKSEIHEKGDYETEWNQIEKHWSKIEEIDDSYKRISKKENQDGLKSLEVVTKRFPDDIQIANIISSQPEEIKTAIHAKLVKDFQLS